MSSIGAQVGAGSVDGHSNRYFVVCQKGKEIKRKKKRRKEERPAERRNDNTTHNNNNNINNKRLETRRELKISSVELIPLHFYLCFFFSSSLSRVTNV